jgi:dihydrofolate reductase
MGSGELIETLMRRELIDEYLLVIHPLVLGTGWRMFADGVPPTDLRLVDSKTTAKGVVIALTACAPPVVPVTYPRDVVSSRNR